MTFSNAWRCPPCRGSRRIACRSPRCANSGVLPARQLQQPHLLVELSKPLCIFFRRAAEPPADRFPFPHLVDADAGPRATAVTGSRCCRANPRNATTRPVIAPVTDRAPMPNADSAGVRPLWMIFAVSRIETRNPSNARLTLFAPSPVFSTRSSERRRSCSGLVNLSTISTTILTDSACSFAIAQTASVGSTVRPRCISMSEKMPLAELDITVPRGNPLSIDPQAGIAFDGRAALDLQGRFLQPVARHRLARLCLRRRRSLAVRPGITFDAGQPAAMLLLALLLIALCRFAGIRAGTHLPRLRGRGVSVSPQRRVTGFHPVDQELGLQPRILPAAVRVGLLQPAGIVVPFGAAFLEQAVRVVQPRRRNPADQGDAASGRTRFLRRCSPGCLAMALSDIPALRISSTTAAATPRLLPGMFGLPPPGAGSAFIAAPAAAERCPDQACPAETAACSGAAERHLGEGVDDAVSGALLDAVFLFFPGLRRPSERRNSSTSLASGTG